MIKKLCTLFIVACFAAPSVAQNCCNSNSASFAPKKGQFQFSVFLGGQSNTYAEGSSYYLLPSFSNKSGSIGLPNGSSLGSGELRQYLNIEGLNGNNLTNIVGFETKYFVSDCLDINFQFGMDINLTPKKDFIEGDNSVPDMIIPAQDYVNAQMTNDWYASIGLNRYFKTSNPRIQPYVGLSAGFQMARIETTEPYTGEYLYEWDENKQENVSIGEKQLYVSGSRAGQMFGIKAAGVAGIEYSIAPGMIFGFQFQPLAYRYDVIQICAKGYENYNLDHHSIKVFSTPMFKIGFRF